MSGFLQVFCALFSSFLTAAAIPNEILLLGSPVLGLLALIPLYIGISRSRSFLEAALLTGLQTGMTHLFSSFWLAFFRDFAVFTLGASALGTAAIGFVAGCYLYLPFSKGTAGRASLPFRVIYFALVWTGYEWAKSTGFLGYPWGTLSITAARWNEIRQIAAITGERGVCFLFALFAGVLSEGLLFGAKEFQPRTKTRTAQTKTRTTRTASLRKQGTPRAGDRPEKPDRSVYTIDRGLQAEVSGWVKAALFCALLFALSLAYGFYHVTRPITPEKTLRAVLVQQNLDTWEATEAQSITVSQRLTERAAAEGLRKTGAKPDIAVWSEGILSAVFPEGEEKYRTPLKGAKESLSDFIRRMDFPFLIGGVEALDRSKRHYGNAVLYYDKNGDFVEAYSKIHLVPFAEIIPFADSPLMQKAMMTIVGFSYAWTPGAEQDIFEVPLRNKDGSLSGEKAAFSAPICFEDAFGILCRGFFWKGSEVFINLTNDSWSLTKSAEYQHYVLASYRAIELRATLARSTNSGYTVVVDPRGKVLADLPLFTEEGLFTEIPVYARVVTPFALGGDWFCYTVLLLILGCWLYLRKGGGGFLQLFCEKP